ncbi:hypothetical protein ASE04_18950 [Rhizobium sp. Root708]|nr:hypothetical protein ASE04_18950 [Rhizobium sp. Root708]
MLNAENEEPAAWSVLEALRQENAVAFTMKIEDGPMKRVVVPAPERPEASPSTKSARQLERPTAVPDAPDGLKPSPATVGHAQGYSRAMMIVAAVVFVAGTLVGWAYHVFIASHLCRPVFGCLRRARDQ